mgnify:CR=1 FL=1
MEETLSRYSKRGVSASKTEVHDAIKNLDKGLYPHAFCKVIPDIVGNDPAYCNIMHADTAGTKTVLAYMFWRETGDASVWRNIVQDAIVMNIDDMACVGCVDNYVLSSTIGRNKSVIKAEVVKTLIEATDDFCKFLKSVGINMYLAGGETADVGDIVRTADVGFTVFSRLKRENIIENKISADNVIVGLASTGKATYEKFENSGIGCNGLTSARHDVLDSFYAKMYPETFDPSVDKDVIFSGSKRLSDTFTINNQSARIGDWLLSPTRTFTPIIKKVIETVGAKNLAGIIHNTGGGQTKVIKFAENVRIIKNNLFAVPQLFQLIQHESKTPWYEMYKVFNMGHRLEFYCSEQVAEQIINISKGFNVEAKIIGCVEALEDKTEVIVESEKGRFVY